MFKKIFFIDPILPKKYGLFSQNTEGSLEKKKRILRFGIKSIIQ